MRPATTSLQPVEKICLSFILIGILLRFRRLGELMGPMEVASLEPARLRMADMLRLLAAPSSGLADPPLFYLQVRGWISLFGDSSPALHFMTACIGSAAVLATAWTGRLIGGRATGLAAAALMALHPGAVAYSQEARSYCLLMLAIPASIGFLHEAFLRDREGCWWGFAGTTLVALYAHNYGLVYWASATVFIAAESLRRRKLPPKGFWLSYAALAGAYAPWLRTLSAQATGNMFPMSRLSIPNTLYAVSGLGLSVENSRSVWRPPRVAAALGLAYCGLAVASARRLWAQRPSLSLLLASCGVSGVAMAYVGSIELQRPFFAVFRHSLIAVPPACLFWGVSIDAERSTRRKLALLAFCLALFAYPLFSYFTHPKSYLGEMAVFIKSRMKPGCELIVESPFNQKLLDYFDLANSRARRDLSGIPDGRLPPGIVLTEFRRHRILVSLKPRDWVWLRSRYRLAEKRSFGEYQEVVAVYELKPR